ncbi:hypothetical protein Sango_1862900 [Sesamum angolense]|uniref:Retrotransposon gag domain-containing protein n=1 Tax=Sesamum angolense TaxID=2727404 RepID=A0AAE2BQD6_9LAMI|nr:hypothetical protein Sango_1862900 [Sesamum angolense]
MKCPCQSNHASQSKIPTNQTVPRGAIACVPRPYLKHTELEKEEPSKGRLQNSLYAIPQVTELKKEEPTVTNFGTPSGTALPFIRRKALHGYSRKSCEAGEFQTRHIKVFKLKYQSVGVTTRNMSKKLKESSQMSHLTEYVEKNLHSSSYASESDANKSPPTSPHFVSSYSFTTNVAPIMVTNATTIEEQLASLTRAIEGLTKHVQEQDTQIARLINKADNIDASHVIGKQVEAHDEVEVPIKQHYTENDKSTKEIQISSDGLIPVNQLKEFIEGTIRRKGSSRSSFTYSNPYTPRIDSLKMPMGYQPPTFQQFDGKYTNLEADSIDGWKQLEQRFLNRFYNTRRTVSMVELTNSRQWKEEPVVDYINRWRDLSLNCKDRLSEASIIEMCIQGMH